MGEAKRKKRSEAIYGTTASAETTEIAVTYDHSTGRVSFGADMVNVYSEVTYERRKGPKTLSRVPQTEREISFSGGDALKRNFDFVVAVDTNTREIQGKRVSVTGVVTAKHMIVPGPRGLTDYWKFDVPFCIEFVGVKTKPENLGWVATLEQLYLKAHIATTTRIGMIVDSDLGNIPAYNSRKTEVVPGTLLPENVQLVYASSDAGKENIVNKILAIADSVSSQSLAAVQSGAAPFNTTMIDSPWYETMRMIAPRVIAS
jgi:hypothetical protein